MNNKIIKNLLLHAIIVTQIQCATIQVPSTGYPATNTGLQGAINASNNGDTVEILANTIIDIDTTPIDINKPLFLQGQDKNTSIITTSNQARNIIATSSNVTIQNLKIRNEVPNNSACIATDSNLDNLIFINLNIELSYMGIILKESAAFVANNYMKYINFSICGYRFIRLYGNKQAGPYNGNYISGNTFDANNIVTGGKTILFELTRQSGTEAYDGNLTIEYNKIINPTNINYFVFFNQTNGNLQLTLFKNEIVAADESTGYSQPYFLVIETSINNPMDYFSQIGLFENLYSSKKGSGLLTFTGNGGGGPFNIGDTNNKIFMCGNQVTYPEITDVSQTDLVPGYGLASYETSQYNPFTINLPACVESVITRVAKNLTKKCSMVATTYYPNKTYDFLIITNPSHGTLSSIYEQNNKGTNLLGTVEYTPNNDYIGTDLFKYQVTDGSVTSFLQEMPLNVLDIENVSELSAALMAKY